MAKSSFTVGWTGGIQGIGDVISFTERPNHFLIQTKIDGLNVPNIHDYEKW